MDIAFSQSTEDFLVLSIAYPEARIGVEAACGLNTNPCSIVYS